MGVKRTRNAGSSKVYPLSGGALAPLFKVMLRLDGCWDLLCSGIQPNAVRFLVVWTGFREECLPGGRCFCRVFTFRQVNYYRRCVAVSEARWLVRRLSFATVLCSLSVGVVGEVCHLH